VIPRIELARGPYDCAENADALVIVTEWEQFRALDFERLRAVMKQPVLVDLRNVYRPEDIEGFTYHGIGRSSVAPHL
jgi:UDPglucose 6-dehydrogenase